MRIKTAHIALLISILALAVSLFTAVQVSSSDQEALIDALMAQNQQLQAQIDALGPRVPAATEPDTTGITLTAAALPDGSGADVTLILESDTNVSALLRVMLGSQVITEAPCVSDGSRLMATARIPAENGYTYSVVMGSEVKTLASPENPVYPDLVYLADALSAYCMLVVDESYVRDNILTLTSGYARIQAPALGGAAALTCTDARLVLKTNGAVLAEVPISPAADDETGGYFCDIAGISLSLPELADGSEVDLHLEVTLSDGQVLTHFAATWYAMSGRFTMSAG